MSAGTESSLAPLKLEAVLSKIAEISTLPTVALRVMEVARDPESGAADLKEVVESDPALSARVLRMVNSAAFGVTQKVSNLHQAVGFLGFTQVRNLALTASVSQIFKDDRQIGCYKRKALWTHLVTVGVCARLVARRCGLSNFEDAFLAGLLHDIGIIMMDQSAHDHFVAVIGALDQAESLSDVEREIVGFSHAVLGDAIAEQWRFPSPIRAAILHHHDAMRFKGDGEELVRCVEVANVITTLKGVSSVGVRLLKPPLKTLKALRFSREDLLVLAQDLDGELKRNESLFEI